MLKRQVSATRGDPLKNKTASEASCEQGASKPSTILGAYQEHVAALKRYVMRILHVEGDVEDVVQEAFLRAYKAEAGNSILQPKSYLFRVAKHVALNQVRQKVTRPTDFLEDSDSSNVLASEDTLEDEVIAQERLGIHCAAVAALPPRRRKVYLLRKVYGMSQKEIALSLDITVSTVEAHLVKAYRQCHERVLARTHSGEVGLGSARLKKEGASHG